MSGYIEREGNLASTPKLETNEKGSWCVAPVIVNDSTYHAESGTWETTGTTRYSVIVTGDAAEGLVHAAASGNIRITFAGRYQVRQFTRPDGTTGLSHDVRAHIVGVSLRGQRVTVTSTKKTTEPAEADDQAPEAE